MIERTTKIGELLEKAPEKAEILLNAGMHCLGCPASQAETIEEACEVHGIDVEELLEEINKLQENLGWNFYLKFFLSLLLKIFIYCIIAI